MPTYDLSMGDPTVSIGETASHRRWAQFLECDG